MIYESSRSITSSLTPEWARRSISDEEPAWELSWRPEQRFTREQARDAMELTQILSDPHSGTEGHRRAEEIAEWLGISVADAAEALYRRKLERGQS
ncbi:hypothetical protein HLB23_04460 [Nocardia uniformis]|uniref:Uncharacterized protein n=1 Tax=Nocardia uniformis TaxID=53432 RepID=A0A849BXY1_9NOCA|nr:hypothetical protein [Nocardia uniformis]NNH69130.1 hypothetical protein [Nocardia uniformis]